MSAGKTRTLSRIRSPMWSSQSPTLVKACLTLASTEWFKLSRTKQKTFAWEFVNNWWSMKEPRKPVDPVSRMFDRKNRFPHSVDLQKARRCKSITLSLMSWISTWLSKSTYWSGLWHSFPSKILAISKTVGAANRSLIVRRTPNSSLTLFNRRVAMSECLDECVYFDKSWLITPRDQRKIPGYQEYHVAISLSKLRLICVRWVFVGEPLPRPRLSCSQLEEEPFYRFYSMQPTLAI